MITAFDELNKLYFSMRHYGDEYKAYAPENYNRMGKLLVKAFYSMYRVNLETGNVIIREDLTEEKCKSLMEGLMEAEKRLVPEHDPEADKIYLWNKDNIPWHLIKSKDWEKISHDGPEFRPHLIPFLQNDGKKHPTAIITGGSFRSHMHEGFPVAEFYQAHGYNAFVLNNRHGMGAGVRRSMNRALDLQRAVRLIRAKADEYGVDSEKIISNCFSMGNRQTINLINDLGVHARPEVVDPDYLPDAVDFQNARLNAYAGIYPATFPYDNHNNYTDFPPSFFVMGNKDWSLWRMMPFVADLAQNGVRVELHLYDGVDHGFGLGDYKFAPEGAEVIPSLTQWPNLLLLWLERIFG